MNEDIYNSDFVDSRAQWKTIFFSSTLLMLQSKPLKFYFNPYAVNIPLTKKPGHKFAAVKTVKSRHLK